MSKGKIIVIVAPSGTGKSTLIKKLKEDVKDLVESVSFTTRKIRESEVDGQSYNFIDQEKFLQMKEAGEFLEWAQVHGNYYGTSKSFVEKQLSNGVNLLFDLDVQGTDSFKAHFGNSAKVIFIAPPSVEVLEQRLLNRGTESDESLRIRLANAKKELERQHDFDYRVVNDELERSYCELKSIVVGELK